MSKTEIGSQPGILRTKAGNRSANKINRRADPKTKPQRMHNQS